MKRLCDWLVSAYPSDVPMPAGRGNKMPLFAHADGAWSWTALYRWQSYHITQRFDWGILLKELCVVDVDDPPLAAELEERFPVLCEVPCEMTTHGRHYFFARSSLCDSAGFYDQRSGVIAKVDLKTRCRTGTAGFIIVAPSLGKQWLRTPWQAGDVLAPIPEDLLRAVAAPTHPRASVTLSFRDGDMVLRDDPELFKFKLINVLIEDGEEIPIGIGDVRTMATLLHFCRHRTYPDWPIDLGAVRELADYLLCSEKLSRALSSTVPSSPTAWLHCLSRVDEAWATARVRQEVIEVTPSTQLFYAPLAKDAQWLFPSRSAIGLAEGTPLLREDISAHLREALPDAVARLMARVPQLALAGGAMLDAACPHLLVDPNDFDLYYIGDGNILLALEEAHDILGPTTAVRTGAAYTFARDDMTVQIILRRYVDVAHVIRSFDMAPCQIVWFGGRIFATREWTHSMRHMSICVDFRAWTTASVSRIYKYYSKGFEILVPATDRARFRQRFVKGPGVANIFAVEAEMLREHWWVSPANRSNRPSGEDVRKTVRRVNFFGARHASGYEGFVGSSMLYVARAIVQRGLTWVGLYPRRASRLELPIAVPDASTTPFHGSSPCFSSLYE